MKKDIGKAAVVVYDTDPAFFGASMKINRFVKRETNFVIPQL
jgi:hypothetical protein